MPYNPAAQATGGPQIRNTFAAPVMPAHTQQGQDISDSTGQGQPVGQKQQYMSGYIMPGGYSVPGFSQMAVQSVEYQQQQQQQPYTPQPQGAMGPAVGAGLRYQPPREAQQVAPPSVQYQAPGSVAPPNLSVSYSGPNPRLQAPSNGMCQIGVVGGGQQAVPMPPPTSMRVSVQSVSPQGVMTYTTAQPSNLQAIVPSGVPTPPYPQTQQHQQQQQQQQHAVLVQFPGLQSASAAAPPPPPPPAPHAYPYLRPGMQCSMQTPTVSGPMQYQPGVSMVTPGAVNMLGIEQRTQKADYLTVEGGETGQLVQHMVPQVNLTPSMIHLQPFRPPVPVVTGTVLDSFGILL